MNGWTEDDATDVRTRDLNQRQRDIMGGIGKPWVPTITDPHVMKATRLYFEDQAHPRRVDWLRVAALTGIILAACAAAAALIVGLAYFFTYPW